MRNLIVASLSIMLMLSNASAGVTAITSAKSTVIPTSQSSAGYIPTIPNPTIPLGALDSGVKGPKGPRPTNYTAGESCSPDSGCIDVGGGWGFQCKGGTGSWCTPSK